MTHTYQITGMTCGSCVSKVKSELLKLGAVSEAEVALSPPQATIRMQTHIPLNTLQEAVSKAGKFTITATQDHSMMSEGTADSTDAPSYYPIFLIFSFIAGVAVLAQWPIPAAFSITTWMRHFMAGFFLVFSFFKLLNLQGFASGYRTYDLVAKKIPSYAFIYPFLELGLGIAFLINLQPVIANLAALVIMGVSTIGVANSLWRKQAFQCACLGTIIKLPLSKVTLFEDVLMVVMSAAMLLSMIN